MPAGNDNDGEQIKKEIGKEFRQSDRDYDDKQVNGDGRNPTPIVALSEKGQLVAGDQFLAQRAKFTGVPFNRITVRDVSPVRCFKDF